MFRKWYLSEGGSGSPQLIFKVFILFVGDQKVAEDFRYRIEISDQSNRNEFQFKGTPKSIRSNIWSLIDTVSGLIFHEKTFKECAKDGRIQMNVCVWTETTDTMNDTIDNE